MNMSSHCILRAFLLEMGRLRTLTQAQLSEYYQQAVIKQQGLALLSEISSISASNDPADYAHPVGGTQFSNASALQQALPVQPKENKRVEDHREP